MSSPLPGYYTEELLDDEWEDREASRGFLDIIHQHLYPLLYKAWLKYRFSHNAVEHNDERYWEIIYSILGLPQEFREFGDLSTQFLKYTGIINQRPKTSMGLKTVLADYLSPIPVDIEPCNIRNVSISENHWCLLTNNNNTLGEDCVIGKQVSDRMGKYTLRIGPLSVDQFQTILTNEKHLTFIRTISNIFLMQPLLCEIELLLEQGSAQPVCLGDPQFSSLGQSTWLVNQNNKEAFSVRLN